MTADGSTVLSNHVGEQRPELHQHRHTRHRCRGVGSLPTPFLARHSAAARARHRLWSILRRSRHRIDDHRRWRSASYQLGHCGAFHRPGPVSCRKEHVRPVGVGGHPPKPISAAMPSQQPRAWDGTPIRLWSFRRPIQHHHYCKRPGHVPRRQHHEPAALCKSSGAGIDPAPSTNRFTRTNAQKQRISARHLVLFTPTGRATLWDLQLGIFRCRRAEGVPGIGIGCIAQQRRSGHLRSPQPFSNGVLNDVPFQLPYDPNTAVDHCRASRNHAREQPDQF